MSDWFIDKGLEESSIHKRITMKYPCIESTIDFEIPFKVIRLWLKEDYIKEVFMDNIDLVSKMIQHFTDPLIENKITHTYIVEWICKNVSHINAIQIKEETGKYGIMVYTVDF